MYKICFYVPELNLETVKAALFKAGIGSIGDYDCCCWQTLGTRQFRPLEGSSPYIGKQGTVEIIPEYKVEMVCEDHLVDAAIAALRTYHPYEEPAFEIWLLDSRCNPAQQ